MTGLQRNKDSVAKWLYAGCLVSGNGDKEDQAQPYELTPGGGFPEPRVGKRMVGHWEVRILTACLRRESYPGSEGRRTAATGCTVNIPRSFPLRVAGTGPGKFRTVGQVGYGLGGNSACTGYGVI